MGVRLPVVVLLGSSWIKNRSHMVVERYCMLPRPVSPPPTLEQLTPAERSVLEYVCAGYSNKEIASLLGKAEPTVKHQVSACLRKFNLSSRMRLMAALR